MLVIPNVESESYHKKLSNIHLQIIFFATSTVKFTLRDFAKAQILLEYRFQHPNSNSSRTRFLLKPRTANSIHNTEWLRSFYSALVLPLENPISDLLYLAYVGILTCGTRDLDAKTS